LQEVLLSRRILTYGFGSIEWECLSSSASSKSGQRSHTRTSLDLSESLHFKRALYGFRSTSMTSRSKLIQVGKIFLYLIAIELSQTSLISSWLSWELLGTLGISSRILSCLGYGRINSIVIYYGVQLRPTLIAG
jgi:hypothetical protein